MAQNRYSTLQGCQVLLREQSLRGKYLSGSISRLSKCSGSSSISPAHRGEQGSSQDQGVDEEQAALRVPHSPVLSSSCFARPHAHPLAVTGGKGRICGESFHRPFRYHLGGQVPGLESLLMLPPTLGEEEMIL